MELSIVVPCYNEEEVLDTTLRELLGLLGRLVACGKVSETKIVLVDDGSTITTECHLETRRATRGWPSKGHRMVS